MALIVIFLNGALCASEGTDSGAANYNIARALYRKGSFNEAISHFNRAIASGDSRITSRADYNIGNCLYRLGQLELAISYYKRAIDLDPNDKDAKFNYEYVSNQLKARIDKKDESKEKDTQKKQDKDKDREDKNMGGGSSQKGKQENKSGSTGTQKEEGKDSGQAQAGQGESSRQKEESKSQQEDKAKEDEAKQSAGSGEAKEKKPEEVESRGAEPRTVPNPNEALHQSLRDDAGQVSGSWTGARVKKSLEFYQSPQQQGEPYEMSAEEAKMLLEGYKGEEAAPDTVRMRRKPVDEPEPEKNW